MQKHHLSLKMGRLCLLQDPKKPIQSLQERKEPSASASEIIGQTDGYKIVAPQKQEFKTFGLKLNNTCRQVHSAVNEDN